MYDVSHNKHLSLSDYKSLSGIEKKRLEDRVRQCASRAREYLPSTDHGIFCLTLQHLARNAHKYFDINEPTEIQNYVMNTGIRASKKELLSEFKEVNQKVRAAGEMRAKNRKKEHSTIVQDLKMSYSSLREMSIVSGISKKTLQIWCSAPEKKMHKATELMMRRKEEYERFLLQDTISFEHPCKKYAGKRFLRYTMDIIREKYKQQTEFHKYGMVSVSCMKEYRPKYMMLFGDIPLDSCLCNKCENCEQLLKKLQRLGLSSIPSNRYDAVNIVVCNERVLQVGSMQSFAKYECIAGECDLCGTDVLKNIIEQSNCELFSENKSIVWRRWMNKPGKSAPDNLPVKGTLKQAVEYLVEMIKPLTSHLFRSQWNRNVYDHIRKHLEVGFIVQLFDFAMNFRNFYQKEIQSAHWDGTQTCIHAVINNFLCRVKGCKEVVTVVLAQISEDLQHDSFVARAGHEAAFKWLAEEGIPMRKNFQFCDNCAHQYKSRRPFAELSRSPLDITRIYFGESHGKSQCDGFFGRLKKWMTNEVKAEHVVLNSAHDFFRHCKNEYEKPPPEKGQCEHYRVIFQFLKPSDIRRHHDCNLDRAIEGTQKLFEVKNTKNPLELLVRQNPCLCPGCIDGSGHCANSSFVTPWKKVDLVPVKGDNKRKHDKRKHPCENLTVQNDEENLSDDDDKTLPDLVIPEVEDSPECNRSIADDGKKSIIDLTNSTFIAGQKEGENVVVDLTGADPSGDTTVMEDVVTSEGDLDEFTSSLESRKKNRKRYYLPSFDEEEVDDETTLWDEILGNMLKCQTNEDLILLVNSLPNPFAAYSQKKGKCYIR